MSTRRTRRTRPDAVTVAKDLVRFSLGTLLIGWQGFAVPRQEFNWAIMVAGGILAGVPGWIHFWAPRTGGDTSPPGASPPERRSASSSTE
jgi:protein-S-isoprenylcysteine O-methyltransferase Ste14